MCLELVCPLLDERVLQPLFELHVTHFCLLCLFELFLLRLLDFHQFLVVSSHDLLVLPLKHCMRSLLHSKRLFFLLLDQSLKEISLCLNDKLLLKFGLMVLFPCPLFMRDLDRLLLHLQNHCCLRMTSLHCHACV
jgi:hypothetical protein